MGKVLFTILWGASVAWGIDPLADLKLRSLRYFREQIHPVSGLVRDRARNFGMDGQQNRVSSIAATGMGYGILAHAAVTGQIPREDAISMIRRGLEFVETKLFHKDGFFYHFINWESGERAWLSEISTIDTALFLMGAMYADELLQDPVIHSRVTSLYSQMDFVAMMTNGGTKPGKRWISMGWTPEFGYLPYDWGSYSELQVLLFLGLGHPSRPLPRDAWTGYRREPDHPEGIVGAKLPLFIHQYSQVFLDLRTFQDDGLNYFANSIAATHADRKRGVGNPEGFWGLSASDGPNGYRAYSPIETDGTYCLGCAAASIVFTPEAVMEDLQRWTSGPAKDFILGSYGFADGFNPSKKWRSDYAIGITVGALYYALANHEKVASPWDILNRTASVRRAFTVVQKAPQFPQLVPPSLITGTVQ